MITTSVKPAHLEPANHINHHVQPPDLSVVTLLTFSVLAHPGNGSASDPVRLAASSRKRQAIKLITERMGNVTQEEKSALAG